MWGRWQRGVRGALSVAPVGRAAEAGILPVAAVYTYCRSPGAIRRRVFGRKRSLLRNQNPDAHGRFCAMLPKNSICLGFSADERVATVRPRGGIDGHFDVWVVHGFFICHFEQNVHRPDENRPKLIHGNSTARVTAI